MLENQHSISEWSISTFGPLPGPQFLAARLTEQAAQLVMMLNAGHAYDRQTHKLGEIILSINCLATALQVDLARLTDSTMLEMRKLHRFTEQRRESEKDTCS